jgi:ABC-type Zn uptake system ZnuABC Zn-binding protein ZnuA
MIHFYTRFFTFSLLFLLLATGCRTEPLPNDSNPPPKGIATESFLADIAQNIAGDNITFSSLIPVGVDPHAFEPVPSDVVKVTESEFMIENGAGLEDWLRPILDNAQGKRLEVTASEGLTSRKPSSSEQGLIGTPGGVDPHFWLDPHLVITYVKNIRDGLIKVDPAGTDGYNTRAEAYISQLNELDLWIKSRVAEIPTGKRLLVTNHETLGYFADRYGFTIIGSIIPGTSTGISPGAGDIAALEEKIHATGAKAIFVETGSNLDLASQISSDTGIIVVTDLYTHSLSDRNGPAPTYIEMMKNNVNKIVNALKGD